MDLWNLFCNVVFILMVLGLGYTLGILYGSGIESCQAMIKMYGCNLEGYSTMQMLNLTGNLTDTPIKGNIMMIEEANKVNKMLEKVEVNK